jgi:arylsulfatase A-like enzyme
VRKTKNTIVILWSDNGFHLGKKFTLQEEVTRVLFIIKDFRYSLQKGRNMYVFVSLINIYKTIANKCLKQLLVSLKEYNDPILKKTRLIY